MFLPGLQTLRQTGAPVRLREHPTLLKALAMGLSTLDAPGFSHFARTILVKYEPHFNRFDPAFAIRFAGAAKGADAAGRFRPAPQHPPALTIPE